MRRIGPCLWILTGCAGLVVLCAGIRGGGRPLQDPAVSGQLLQLADQTNARLARMVEGLEPPDEPLQAGSEEEQMMRCQAVFLQMREVENLLAGTGAEVELADDLEAWVAHRGGSLGSGWEAGFLRQILAWLRIIAQPDSRGRLERLMVIPDPKGGFPALSMEMAGSAVWIGGKLLELENQRSGWRLAEIDLRRMEQSDSWWMRGSMDFLPVDRNR